jgi:ABC-type uncharacterized transport system ATPase component
MELYQGGMTKNLLDMSVEEALALQENLANAINHALKFGTKASRWERFTPSLKTVEKALHRRFLFKLPIKTHKSVYFLSVL